MRPAAGDAKADNAIAARLFETAPLASALIAFFAGAVTLLAAVIPSLPHIRGLDGFERMLEEMPELTASIAGVALMALATGLSRRLDAAWAATTALLGAVALYAFFRHEHVVAAMLAALAAVVLGLSRRAFYRRARIVDVLPDRRIALAIAAAIGVALVGALLWAGGREGFAQAPWWALFADPHLGRPGRALGIGALAFGFILVERYVLGRRKGAPSIARDEDFTRVDGIIAAAPEAPPDAQLAFTGDKSFVFVDGAFVMTARSGASLVSMLGAVGKRDACRSALVAFRAEAERLSLRPVIYAASPQLLPELLDLGFRVEKVGENAIVDPRTFSLRGGARQNLRTARKRLAEREGATFEVRRAPHDDALWHTLRPVSDAWLAMQGDSEKGFSLGAFEPAYLSRHDIAIVWQHGAPIAFCNVWLNAGRKRAAIDLMRYDPAHAPNGLMDFLFTELLLWAQAEEMEAFDLGMAPLAGLATDQYASLFARIGRLIAQLGEQLYGFEGLRAFKNKFGPVWEPRYIAAPGSWALPVVLADVALLTNVEGRRARRGPTA